MFVPFIFVTADFESILPAFFSLVLCTYQDPSWKPQVVKTFPHIMETGDLMPCVQQPAAYQIMKPKMYSNSWITFII
jgi:hypothetical protein